MILKWFYLRKKERKVDTTRYLTLLNHLDRLYFEVYVLSYFTMISLFVRLFGVYRPTRESLIWRRHHYRWLAANFDPCSALMAIEQWGFFSLPHLLWHGASVYNSHLRGPIAERLAGAVTICFYDLGLSRLGFEDLTFRLRAKALTHRRGHNY